MYLLHLLILYFSQSVLFDLALGLALFGLVPFSLVLFGFALLDLVLLTLWL